MELEFITTALSVHMPPVMRWAGAVAKRMRQYNIAVEGKHSGSVNTDALTVADLSVQELLVSALRDTDPIFRHCGIQAEESTGDLHLFPSDAEYTISLDPIDGTKCYRDRTGGAWAVMLHLRSAETVHYSLVFIPETGRQGTWVEAEGEHVIVGDDDPSRPAEDVLLSLPPVDSATRPDSKKIYTIGFLQRDSEVAEKINEIGLEGYTADDMPGSIFELFGRGEFGGSLIHSPNVYDFPVSLHIARAFGGDAVWIHNGEPVHFRETWLDDRADMLRLPGIVACATNRETLSKLVDLARDWNPRRYPD